MTTSRSERLTEWRGVERRKALRDVDLFCQYEYPLIESKTLSHSHNPGQLLTLGNFQLGSNRTLRLDFFQLNIRCVMIKWYLVVYEEMYSFAGVDINSLPYSEYFANSETHLTYCRTKVEQFAK